jgi:hypothetical protein
MYDSTEDTKNHQKAVRHFMSVAIMNLAERRESHDASKLKSPEKEMYDKYTPLLRDSTYGSDEYKAMLKEMGPALQHHYENNSHHPEHFEDGINGMSLLDLLEMFCDWQAACLRHGDGDITKSLEINKERFGMSDQLSQIFWNTLEELWA